MWIYLILIILTSTLVCFPSGSHACDSGWFGSPCEYKCHCQNNNCDTDGTCTGDNKCERGWFGPLCQYVDLVQNGSTTPVPQGIDISMIKNGDDGSCISGLQSVTIDWNTAYPFTWIRVVVKDSVSPDSLEVSFRTASMSTHICTNRRHARINNRTVDIQCDLNVTVQEVTLSGDGVKSLCSLYVSGGRNVALKQTTTQSTTYGSWDSYKAVDGTATSTSNSVTFCSSTQESKTVTQSLNITLTSPRLVNRYVLYNRVENNEDYRSRLQKFTIRSLNENGALVFNYTDPGTTQNVYTVTSVPMGSPVSQVQVYARDPDTSTKSILTLCEFEMYSECPPKSYEFDCSRPCSNNCQGSLCHHANGHCYACYPGKIGDFCNVDCPTGYFGQECTAVCNRTCGEDKSCHGENGQCSHGCQPGYKGLWCEEECPPSFFGKNCLEACSSNCQDELCHRVNGSCFACIPGRLGDVCENACPVGYFGQECTAVCNLTCGEDTSCDGESGQCSHGCRPGYTGLWCEEAETSSSDDSPSVGLIAGVVVGVVVLALVVVAAVVLLRRRQTSKKGESYAKDNDNGIIARISRLVQGRSPRASSGLTALATTPTNSETTEREGEEAYYNMVAKESVHSPTAIPVDKLSAFLLSHKNGYFNEQFKRIPGIRAEATTEAALRPENMKKNRYKNICAYDHSRVILNNEGGKGDYINASYVEGYKNEEKFIATQGPNKVMINDFVRMLWEHKVDKVVMLTNLIEEGKSKCERYWPDEDMVEFGGIEVKLARTQVFADYTIRKLKLKKQGHDGHFLTHFHFTSWPDKGVPTTPWALIDFEQRVASYPTSKPIVVHCSAGVGRTGTFIGLRILMREAIDMQHMDFYSTLMQLRKDRMNMIQTPEQYIFLHKAAQVAVVCMGTTVTSHDITDRMTFLNATSPSGMTNMAKEFEAVCMVCAENDEDVTQESGLEDGVYNVYENSRSATNKLKNRFSNVLPKEQYRPHLTCDIMNTGDYINAVFVPSLSKINNQFLTQLPLHSTVLDFWRLVTQFDVSLVVAFELDSTSDDSTVGVYLPSREGEPLTCDPFSIVAEPPTSGSHWEQQKLIITRDNSKSRKSILSSQEIAQYKVTHLKISSTDLDPQTLLTVVKQVRSHSSSSRGKTLYMCRNGATYSGLVCVLSLLLDRMDNDLCLTVPLVVGAIKSIRPQIIPNLEHYKVLYEVLKRYTETSSSYCNFELNPGASSRPR